MKKIHLFIPLFVFGLSNSYSQNIFGEFSKQEFNVQSYDDSGDMNMFSCLFETKQQLTEFVDLKKGDVVAEIGAGTGINIGILSMFYDSMTFVAQDIDPKSLNNKSYHKTIKKYQKHSNKPQTNKYELVIGTINSTHLPDNKFDVLFIINSFHDFDKQDDMLDDIYKKLKPNGRFILLEGFSFPGDTQVCPDYGPHVLHMLDFEVTRFEKHGFYLTKMRAPYFKAAHYGNGLVFVKNKKETDLFYKEKNEIDSLVKSAFKLKKNELASDSLVVTQITDSLKKKINTVVSVYKEFEVWMKDLGVRHLQKSEFKAAINIFRANTLLFPNSYQAYYWLGLAYEKNKSYQLATENYTYALKFNSPNKICSDRLKAVVKLKDQSH